MTASEILSGVETVTGDAGLVHEIAAIRPQLYSVDQLRCTVEVGLGPPCFVLQRT